LKQTGSDENGLILIGLREDGVLTDAELHLPYADGRVTFCTEAFRERRGDGALTGH